MTLRRGLPDVETQRVLPAPLYATFEDEHEGILTREAIGVENLNWGNDYPHHDSTWPNSMAVLRRIMTGVPEDEVERMCFQNVVDLYQIDVAKLP